MSWSSDHCHCSFCFRRDSYTSEWAVAFDISSDNEDIRSSSFGGANFVTNSSEELMFFKILLQSDFLMAEKDIGNVAPLLAVSLYWKTQTSLLLSFRGSKISGRMTKASISAVTIKS